VRAIAVVGLLSAIVIACSGADEAKQSAFLDAPCDSARAHAVALDTASHIDTLSREVLAWRSDDSGFVASTYPSSGRVLDGGIGVRVTRECRVGWVINGDSV